MRASFKIARENGRKTGRFCVFLWSLGVLHRRAIIRAKASVVMPSAKPAGVLWIAIWKMAVGLAGKFPALFCLDVTLCAKREAASSSGRLNRRWQRCSPRLQSGI